MRRECHRNPRRAQLSASVDEGPLDARGESRGGPIDCGGSIESLYRDTAAKTEPRPHPAACVDAAQGVCHVGQPHRHTFDAPTEATQGKTQAPLDPLPLSVRDP